MTCANGRSWSGQGHRAVALADCLPAAVAPCDSFYVGGMAMLTAPRSPTFTVAGLAGREDRAYAPGLSVPLGAAVDHAPRAEADR